MPTPTTHRPDPEAISEPPDGYAVQDDIRNCWSCGRCRAWLAAAYCFAGKGNLAVVDPNGICPEYIDRDRAAKKRAETKARNDRSNDRRDEAAEAAEEADGD